MNNKFYHKEGFYLKKNLKRGISIKNIYLLLMPLLILTTILILSLQNTISQAQENNIPNFIEMESKHVQEERFSILFPSIPRKTIINLGAKGEKITNYQADDDTGLYTFSLGETKESINDKKTQKHYIKNLFDTLFSTGEDTDLYNCEQSDEYPYTLEYTYTSTHTGFEIIHTGVIFLIDNKTYVKATLLCPTILLESVEKFFENYNDFIYSLEIK